MKDHLQAFQRAGAPNLQNISLCTLVAQIRERLMESIDCYNSGQWKPNTNVGLDIVSEGSDSREEFDFDEGENDWEDVEE